MSLAHPVPFKDEPDTSLTLCNFQITINNSTWFRTRSRAVVSPPSSLDEKKVKFIFVLLPSSLPWIFWGQNCTPGHLFFTLTSIIFTIFYCRCIPFQVLHVCWCWLGQWEEQEKKSKDSDTPRSHSYPKKIPCSPFACLSKLRTSLLPLGFAHLDLQMHWLFYYLYCSVDHSVSLLV